MQKSAVSLFKSIFTWGKVRFVLSLVELKYFLHELPLLHSVYRNNGNPEVSYSLVYVEITTTTAATSTSWMVLNSFSATSCHVMNCVLWMDVVLIPEHVHNRFSWATQVMMHSETWLNLWLPAAEEFRWALRRLEKLAWLFPNQQNPPTRTVTAH